MCKASLRSRQVPPACCKSRAGRIACLTIVRAFRVCAWKVCPGFGKPWCRTFSNQTACWLWSWWHGCWGVVRTVCCVKASPDPQYRRLWQKCIWSQTFLSLFLRSAYFPKRRVLNRFFVQYSDKGISISKWGAWIRLNSWKIGTTRKCWLWNRTCLSSWGCYQWMWRFAAFRSQNLYCFWESTARGGPKSYRCPVFRVKNMLVKGNLCGWLVWLHYSRWKEPWTRWDRLVGSFCNTDPLWVEPSNCQKYPFLLLSLHYETVSN